MADYNDIALLRAETAVMTALSGMIGSALQINPTSDTNIPTDSKRLLDAGGGLWRFENWNGSSWVPVTLDATTLQGDAPGDIDYSAGEGVDIDGSNVISVEQASESNLGGVQLASAGDQSSANKALSPLRAKELIDASVSPVNEVANGQLLVSNGQYMLPASNSLIILGLPDQPKDGAVVRVFSRDASQGAVAFLSPAGDEVILDDVNPRGANTISGTVTTTDNFDLVDISADFSLIDWVGYRVRNITDGSVGVIVQNSSATTLSCGSPFLTNGANNIFTLGDAYTIDGNVAYIPRDMEFGLCELIYRADGGFKRWTYALTGNSAKSMYASPEGRIWTGISSPEFPPVSVYDLLVRFDQALFSVSDIPELVKFETVDFNLNNNKDYHRTSLCAPTSEMVVSMVGISVGGIRKILNIGTANVILRVGLNTLGNGTTGSVLILNGSVVAASNTDIIVPPNETATVYRLNDDFGAVGDAAVAYVEGSAGVTKA